MNRPSTWLQEYKRNVYSQTGEDGIIEKILELIPALDKWCVEFGAYDGRSLSNTRHLIESKGYSAVLIEANHKRFRELQRNYSQRNQVITVNKCVGFGEGDNLDQILSGTSIPVGFDFLSIDIDGNDYHVWKAAVKYKPKALVIEYNPTIPTNISFVQAADPSTSQGSSLLSIVELGKEKGYELVSVSDLNAFFVRAEYYPLFEIGCNAPEVLRTSFHQITYLFSGYDGKVFLEGSRKLPWHGIALRESRIQHLPRFLRRSSKNYTMPQKVLFSLYRLFTDPKGYINRIREKVSSH